MVEGPSSTVIAHNLISGNHQHGVVLSNPGSDKQVYDDIIGADARVAKAVSNRNYGIAVQDSPAPQQIGDPLHLYPNVIVASGWSGVAVANSDWTVVEYNAIGTTWDRTATGLGNQSCGIAVVDGSNNPLKSNRIAYNGGHDSEAGVEVQGATATGNVVASDSIHDNDGCEEPKGDAPGCPFS